MERAFVEWLRQRLPGSPRLKVGLGDDAALLDWSGGRDLVVSADLLAEGVHFLTEGVDPRRIGRKALAVNLSDLAAMAATPVAATLSLLAPRGGACGLDPLALCQRVVEGALELAEGFGVALVGGDTNVWSGGLVIDVTILGEPHPRGPLLRSGARAGDALLVTGPLGGSLLGKQYDFTPRVHEAIALQTEFVLHAGMDLSDGLTLDLSRMLEASGVGAVLELGSIPITDSAHEMSRASGKPPLHHALSDGEDFELLLAMPSDEARRLLASNLGRGKVFPVGECIAQRGLFGSDIRGGAPTPIEPQGYLHQ